MKHLGIAKPVDHPRLGTYEVVGQAITLSRTGGRPDVRLPTPEMGQHTDEVLASLGYSRRDSGPAPRWCRLDGRGPSVGQHERAEDGAGGCGRIGARR